MHCSKLLAHAILALLILACLTSHTAAQEKPIQHKEDVQPDPAPPEGYVPTTDDFKVDITSMNIKETASGPTFFIKGTAKYPDGTFGIISIKFYERVLAGTNKFIQIRNKRFEVTFSASKLWAGKRVFPGNYEVEVQVNPKQQSRSVRAKIKKELGPLADTIEYRNKYVIVGDKAGKKKAEGILKDYYIDMIKTARKLYIDLEKKYKAAKLKYTSHFYKLDKKGKKQIDPNNRNAHLVDEAKFLKFLHDNPNEFYDSSGKFREDAWRNWLDNVWRVELEKAFKTHARITRNYAAIAWPDQYDQMLTVLKMLKKRSGENSIKLYLYAGLPENKKDRIAVGTGEDPNPGVGGTKPVNILKVVKEIRLELKLLKHMKSKTVKPVKKHDEGTNPTPKKKNKPEEKEKKAGKPGFPEKKK